ncbi:ChaN family lipoprotein [Hufsiella ginkgonis]|uniref:Haem-binding uptake Tiki superfamily ChaN domain-containing protein n=1 Tax=Hufsiella ginkgonis TaxID=2695274 RepID=A0A7K1XY56_9SPHI|nr:ChaN family lipoprotein [Hufsiella ginkgonis]MXV15935.1 hypothetical protein [Hufsiella ginkgonis]
MKRMLFLFTMLMPFTGFSQANMEAHYRVYDAAQKKVITIDELVKNVKNADVVFFGEEHNDSIGHYLENRIFEKLYDNYGEKMALSMEMFENDVQIVVDEYLKGLIREKNFIKDARAWSNYKDYRTMIEFAKSKHLPVIAANAPARYTNMVTRGGLPALNGLGKAAKAYLAPLPIDTATGAYYEKFVTTMGGHSAMGGMKIYQSQNLWDATMASSILRYLKKNKDAKVFQVNGRFHSDQKFGAAAQLARYAPKLEIVNISSFSDKGFPNPSWDELASLGDFIIITDPGVKRSY